MVAPPITQTPLFCEALPVPSQSSKRRSETRIATVGPAPVALKSKFLKVWPVPISTLVPKVEVIIGFAPLPYTSKVKLLE